MTDTALDVDAVALAVSDVLKVLDAEDIVVSASVSNVYATGREGEAVFWRVTVSVNDRHVFQPRFGSQDDALAYRVAVGEALDRAI